MLEINPDRLDAGMMKKTLILHPEAQAQGAQEKPRAEKPTGTFQALGTARVDDFAPVRVGHKLDGYEIRENLAEGGMGAVYKVKDREGKRELALKAPLPEGRGGTFTHRLRRFLREVRLTQRMNHPGVARVVEVGQEDGLPYFTMELVEGAPFSDLMFGGPMEIADACEIIENAARAVHHIHEKGVIHRDLKPQNMLVKKDRSVVIIDFGLARDAAGIDPRITQEGVWLGTPAYIAPEQAQGEASVVDARADVYSLAAVLYEAIVGAPPYGAGNTKQIFRNLKNKVAETLRFSRPECPEAVDKVVMKGIAKARENRFATALEFADALAEAREAIAAIPALRVNSAEAACDLDALESVMVDETTPILRAKADKAGSNRSEMRLREDSETLDPRATLPDVTAPRATGWKDHATSNANAKALDLVPTEEERAALAAAIAAETATVEKPFAKRVTEKRIKAVDGKPSSKRLRKRSTEAMSQNNLLVLAGPALLFICGLLLLFH